MSTAAKQFIITGIRTLLRPIAKVCLFHGVSAQDCVELLKLAFVDSAREELESEGHEVNASRLSAATGISRKELGRLTKQSTRFDDSILMKVIGQWRLAKRYLDQKGKPRPLSFEGNESEFAALVRDISLDLNPYTVMFELERTSRVARVDGKLQLLVSVLEINRPEDFPRACEIASNEFRDLLAAIRDNLAMKQETPHLQLRTEFDNIVVDALPALRDWLLDRGTTFHEQVRAHLAKFDKDANPRLHRRVGGARISVGAYSFSIEENRRRL